MVLCRSGEWYKQISMSLMILTNSPESCILFPWFYPLVSHLTNNLALRTGLAAASRGTL